MLARLARFGDELLPTAIICLEVYLPFGFQNQHESLLSLRRALDMQVWGISLFPETKAFHPSLLLINAYPMSAPVSALHSSSWPKSNQGLSSQSVIGDNTRACISRLEACLLVPALKQDGWAENRLAEFKFWNANVGALAPYRASLDYRLQATEDNEIYRTVVRLLELLHAFLEDCVFEGEL